MGLGGRRSKQNLVYQILFLFLLSRFSCLVRGEEKEEEVGCSHPSLPSGATYSNLTGGLGEQAWKIKYSCDIGEKYNNSQTFCLTLKFGILVGR